MVEASPSMSKSESEKETEPRKLTEDELNKILASLQKKLHVLLDTEKPPLIVVGCAGLNLFMDSCNQLLQRGGPQEKIAVFSWLNDIKKTSKKWRKGGH